MALDVRKPNTHFSELLAVEFNTKIENYATTGASNFTIRLQIEQAIKEDADLILIEFTNRDRIELSIDSKEYNPLHGIKNIEYDPPRPQFYDESFVTTQSNVISNYPQTSPITNWVTYLYDNNLKLESDYYIASGVLDKLIRLNIPFIFTDGGLCSQRQPGWQPGEAYERYQPPDLTSIINWHPWSQYQVDTALNPWHSLYELDNAYHTTLEEQRRLAAGWAEKIKNVLKISTGSC
jgi:hypothetical protein